MSDVNDFLAFFRDKTENNPLRGGSVNIKGNIEEDLDNLGVTNNPEGLALLGLAYVAAFTPGTSINKLASFGGVNDATVTAKFPRNYVPAKTGADPDDPIARGADHANGNTPKYVPAKGSADDYGEYGEGNIHLCPDADLLNAWNIVVKGHNDWKGHFFSFVAASEAQDLSAKHFKSFFAWKRTPNIEGDILAKHFHKLTGGMISILGHVALRDIMVEGKWMDYRTTFASSGGLLIKMLEECPEEYLKVFSDETKATIIAYQNSKWNEAAYRAIPEKCLGILYAYLLITEQLPDDLPGPKKAWDKLSIQSKESLKIWFKEAKDSMKVYRKGPLLGIAMPPDVFDV